MMLAKRIAAALAKHGNTPLLQAGDDYWEQRSGGRPQQDAAVLVAFVDHPRPTILLTRRTDALRQHSGQVAFPGGRIDAGDADPAAAALREAQEEVGLASDAVHLIGPTAPYRTVTNYCVTPVLAVIPPGLALMPNAGEVARIFETPVDILFNPACQVQRSVEWNGQMRTYHEIHHDGERIWGATAAMIRNLGVQLGLAAVPDLWNRAAA